MGSFCSLFPHTHLFLAISLSEETHFPLWELNVGFHLSWHQGDWLTHPLQHFCSSIPQSPLHHSNHLGNTIRFFLPAHSQTHPAPDSIFTRLSLYLSSDVLSKRVPYMLCFLRVGSHLYLHFFTSLFLNSLSPLPSAESNVIQVTKGFFLLHAVLAWAWVLWLWQKCQITIVWRRCEVNYFSSNYLEKVNHLGTSFLLLFTLASLRYHQR